MRKAITIQIAFVSGVLCISTAWGAHPGFDAASFSMATSAKGRDTMAKQPVEEKPGPLSGTVVQTMDSGGYTYVLLEDMGERRWAAIEATQIAVGEKLVLKPGSIMVNFTSKSLNKTFDRIVFSDGIAERPDAAKAKATKKSSGSAGAVVSSGKISVDKATGPNAYQVSDLYAKKKLNGKKITVRGKVMKVSTGIMDRNWIHLQDGTGSAQKKTHNLVVTSKDVPEVGEVVTVTGILVRDKDFGSGYKYDVIVEKATIVRDTNDAKPATP